MFVNWKTLLQSCQFSLLPLLLRRFSQWPTLCDPIGGSPPGSSVHGTFQARALEWVVIAFSKPQSYTQLFLRVLVVLVGV